MLKTIKKVFKGKSKINEVKELLARKESSATKEKADIEFSKDITNQLDHIKQFPVLTNVPLFIKLSFILNSINEFSNNQKQEDIDWDLVNLLINNSRLVYDYNIDIPKRFTDIDQLYSLRSIIFMAVNDLQPYYRQKCKTCGETFDLNYGEINFYHQQELKVPTHCKPCIKKRKSK